jgi:hypothetical protein
MFYYFPLMLLIIQGKEQEMKKFLRQNMKKDIF